MTRLEKKCALASVVLHGLLLVLVAFGVAFKGKPEPMPIPLLTFIPSKTIEGLLAGGGGNPNVPRTDEQVKGNTTTPVPPSHEAPPAPKPPERPAPVGLPPPVAPRVEPRPAPTPVRPVPVAPTRPAATVKPAVPVRPVPTAKAPTAPPKTILDSLVPFVRGLDKAAKDRAEAQAREAAREAARQQAAANRATENRLNSALAGLKAGYLKGSAVDFRGPGGEAYAGWDATVQAIYRDAMSGVSDFSDQDFLIVVEVAVARSGRVIESRIVRRSGSAVMDKATQKALDDVKRGGLPKFPEGVSESERRFSIDFNLKARRATG